MLQLVRPSPLNPGDTIAIIAPSEPVNKDDIVKTKAFLEAKGYKVKTGKHLFYKIGDYTAGTIEDRAEDLNSAFADGEVKAIFMGVGGYAADQILDLIDYESVAQNPKIFVGYSDATMLQLSFLTKTGLVTFHGPNGAMLSENADYTHANLWPIISGQTTDSITPFSKWEVLRSGKGKGLLIGGNLDSMCSLLGTDYDPFPRLESQKIILFWEEFEEEYSYIIRCLYQLKHARIFDRCEGMLVGKLTDCGEKDSYVGVPELRYTLLQMARAYDFPILWDVDLGHTREKFTIPIGIEGEIDTKTTRFGFDRGVL